VAAGTAIFDGKLIIGGAPSGKSYELKPYRKDDQGRDVYAGPAPVIEDGRAAPRIMEVVTGVPRGFDDSDDDEDSAPAQASEPEPKSFLNLPERYKPVTVREPEPELPSCPPIHLRVQLASPNDQQPGGEIVEAVAFVEPNGTLTVRERATGKPIGTAQVKAGDDFKAAARRVILRQRGPSDFWRSLQ
jgi:hypothetical protein